MILRVYDYFSSKNSKNKKMLACLFFILMILLCYLIFKNIFFSIFIGICVFIVVSEIIRNINENRLEILHNQLIEFLVNMILMIRAGRTVRNIIKEAGKWTKAPLKLYLEHLSNELELNIIFDEALDNFAKRCSSREAVLICTALKLNNKIGGDLVFILSNIIETLQESLKLRANTRTLTLQSRYSGNIIALMPVIILVCLYFFINGPVLEFFSSKIGNILLISGAIMEISGIIIIRKILAVNR